MTNSMLYCQAIFSREGLGNRLLPWARCRIFSFVNKIPMLSPVWSQMKIGTLLRRESDPRFYYNLFKKRPDDIGGIRRIWLQIVARKELEPEDFNLPKIKNHSRSTVIVYEGLKDYFRKLNGWDQFLLQEIRAMTREQWLKEVDRIPMFPIGIHVRRGDFREPKSDGDFYVTGALRTPISWFIDSLRIIREILSFPVKVFVISEGKEKELKELLNVDDVFFVKQGCAIRDLLLLSRAKILIASGGSLFSAWASFLGQMPTISHPGQSLTWFNLINKKGHYLGEFNPKSPPQPFIEQIKDLSDSLR